MTGDRYRIDKTYKIFRADATDEPMDETTEDKLYAWLLARGYSPEQATYIINKVDEDGSAELELP
jgi:SOS response regulatory protein OraA/RecX